MMQRMNVERNKEMVELYKSGLSLRDLGKKYNISFERVRQIIDREKIPPHENGYKKRLPAKDKINIEVIKEERHKGATWADVCKKLGITYLSLIKYIDTKEFPINKERERFCRVCHSYDNIENFYKLVNKKSGKMIYKHKPCARKYFVQWRKNKRENEKSPS